MMELPNIPLLRKTLDHIKAHPQEWDQQTWHCGTAMCFAGHAAMLDGGAEWLHPSDMCEHVADAEGRVTSVATYARRALGLDECQAATLFAPDNDLDDLEEIIGEIESGAWDCRACS
jgi:hypothetical protein